MDHVPGTIYLLHFDRPYKHAKHYLGWARDLNARLSEHEHGTGARLLQVAKAAGIGWTVARTWDGDRYRERQLKKQGGRSRMCPACKHPTPKEASVDPIAPGQAEGAEDGVARADLPADLTAARQARTAVRRALAAWGIDDPSGDAELLASELAANAAEHAGSGPIGLALRRHAQPDGQRGLTCEVTDTSPDLPRPRQARPDEERGRGLAIVTALADASGVRPGHAGKTTWFTLALSGHIERAAPQAQHEIEAGA
jgi:anti-sigma regulatory factor (Ser/Thr protein kinase)/predicted GIY-YIG superfamily endonuclease